MAAGSTVISPGNFKCTVLSINVFKNIFTVSVCVAGKLSQRHQQLLSRNPMLKGLKRSNEEGARSLQKLFPNWPPLALDFISQCLRMDPSQRSTSMELIRHLYFTHDHFSQYFLPILRSKMQEELQGNPLLQKYEAAIFFDSTARNERDSALSGMHNSKGNHIYTPVLTSLFCISVCSPVLKLTEIWSLNEGLSVYET